MFEDNKTIGSYHSDFEKEKGLIEVENVKCSYPPFDQIVLDDLSLVINSGEFVTILGHSGSGKTTLLRSLAGFEIIQEGYIRINGMLASTSWTHLPPEKRKIGFIFQDYALFPHLTVRQNISFGIVGNKNYKKKRENYILDLIGLKKQDNRYPHQLSGGQQQRVALGRALAPNPVAILMDEPFSNLDRQLRSSLSREVRDIIKSSGITAILVTHDREEAMVLSDRVGVLVDGKLIQISEPEKLYRFPASLEVSRMISETRLIQGIVQKRHINTEIGKISIEKIQSGNSTFNEGSSIIASLRPEDLTINKSNSETHGTIVRKEFSGNNLIYCVELKSGDFLHVDNFNRIDSLDEGEHVSLDFSLRNPISVFPK